MRNAKLERHRGLDPTDVRVGECDIQRLEVRVQVLDLSPTDDRKDVRHLLHQVRDRD